MPRISIRSLFFANVVTLAGVLTVLNASKPLHIDDTFYHYHAAHLARRPLEPYAFDIFWNQWPEPAIGEVCPPVLPYWWAAAIRLFGDQPSAWKLWLAPFALLFVCALGDLLRRFAPGLEIPLLWMTVLSPTFLPSFNLMPDIPALALSLAGLAVYFRAADKGSIRLALAAGLIVGLATQTKYTAFVAPAAILAHSLLFHQYRLGLAASVAAGLVFAGWEAFVYLTTGDSHFLYQLGLDDSMRQAPTKWSLFGPMFAYPGGIAPALIVAASAARPRPLLTSVVVGVLIVGAHAALFMGGPTYPIYCCLGVVLWGAVVAAGLALLRARGDPTRKRRPAESGRTELFLLGWLVLEVVFYFWISPFPAARRFMGLVVVMTLLIGRWVSRTNEWRRVVPWVAASVGVALGACFFYVDFREARSRKALASRAAESVFREAPEATIWFVGHWGFQFYAEQAGMQPLIPDNSHVRPGDWVAVPAIGVTRQGLPSMAGRWSGSR